MRIEKNIIEKVANGETTLTGEVVEIAKKIIQDGLLSKFKKFAFFCQGDHEEMLDVQECILDFKSFGAEITVLEVPEEIHPFRKLQVFGMTIEESLQNLFNELTASGKKLELCENKLFTVRGMRGRFRLMYTPLHYCFGEGCISVEECMSMMRI